MAMAPKAESSRKPPEPAPDHAPIDDWMKRVMPDLQPVVQRIDELIQSNIKGLQYALKWKKAFYGTAKQGWLIEVVAYDVSVNIVFLAGEDFPSPPTLGTGKSRYIKVQTVDEVDTPEVKAWIKQAGKHPGWT